jgi:hypothetical protein
MKSISSAVTILGIALLANSTAFAESEESRLARIAALEKENALMRKELAALRQNHALRDQKASIAGASVQAHGKRPQQDRNGLTQSVGSGSPLTAYAADLAFKATPLAEARGQFRVWAEGGATWTGGDPSLLFYTPISLTPISASPQPFDLKPGLGWEGAGGFDYRFANSPWHVSGQFRYGEGTGKGAFATGGSVDPSLLGVSNITAESVNQAVDAQGRERHWLADLAIGRDVLGSGPSSMQVKAGLRISEFRASTSSLEVVRGTITLNPPQMFNGVPISTFSITDATNLTQEARFLGAGPRVGIEGSVPFAGKWAFDYMGDAAVLFGRQRYSQAQNGFSVYSIAGLPSLPLPGFGNSDERSATVFNADLQFGVSYWFTPAVKMTASYRLDAYFNVLTGLSLANDVTKLQTLDRYIHGPRLGVAAQF